MENIFKFDHTQDQISNAIGIDTEYLDFVQNKLNDTCRSLAIDEENETVKDTSTSQAIENVLNNYSYNELVIIVGFYIKEKLIEAEKKAIKAALNEALSADNGFEEFLKKLRGE